MNKMEYGKDHFKLEMMMYCCELSAINWSLFIDNPLNSQLDKFVCDQVSMQLSKYPYAAI